MASCLFSKGIDKLYFRDSQATITVTKVSDKTQILFLTSTAAVSVLMQHLATKTSTDLLIASDLVIAIFESSLV